MLQTTIAVFLGILALFTGVIMAADIIWTFAEDWKRKRELKALEAECYDDAAGDDRMVVCYQCGADAIQAEDGLMCDNCGAGCEW